MLKQKRISYLILNNIIALSTSMLIFSCSLPNQKTLTNESIVLSASSKPGVNIKLNIKAYLKNKDTNSNFKLMSTDSGIKEETSLTTSGGIRVVMSDNSSDPYNNPVSVNSSILIADFDSYPSGRVITLSNLQPNKTYYLAARAFSDSSDEFGTNITEGGTYIVNEYIQVTSNGEINIINDTGDIGEIDFNVPLLSAKGAKVDTEATLLNGKSGDFASKDFSVSKGISPSDNLDSPSISINDYGYGLVSWALKGGSINQINSKIIKDYIPSGSNITYDSVSPSVAILDRPNTALNNKGNGFICWDYKPLSGNGEIRFQHIRNLNNNSVTQSITTGDFSGCNVQVKNYSSPSQDSAIIVWSDVATGNLKAIPISSSDAFNTFNPLNMGSEIDIFSESGSSNKNPSISTINEEGIGVVVWQYASGATNRGIKYAKFEIDTLSTTPSINIIDGPYDISYSSFSNLTDPSISLDKEGNGMVAWVAGQTISYRKFESYKPVSDSKQVPNISSPSVNPKVRINDKGNGLLVWSGTGSEANNYDIEGIRINNYSLSGNIFKIDDVDGTIDIPSDSLYSHQKKPVLGLDIKGSGYISWLDDRTSFNFSPVNEIYGKRIVDFYPN